MEKGHGELTYRNIAKVTSYESRLRLVEEVNNLAEKSKRSDKDPITGLDGKYPLNDMVLGLQSRWENDNSIKGSFIIADLTDLHNVNDIYGERAGGDDYLKAVADIFKDLARGNGRCFRDGQQADTFVLYLPGLKTKEDLVSVLDKSDEELKRKEKSYQGTYPHIRFGLSYCTSSFNEKVGPTESYTEASNKMGEAKKLARSFGKKETGRIFL